MWQVWSIDTLRRRALVVDERNRRDAEESARQRNASAARLGVDNLTFKALPPGQEPSWDEEAGYC